MKVFIDQRLAAGQTLRYHTVPSIGNGQNVAAHSWRAAVLLHTLWPDKVTKNVLLHVLYHDAAEQELGDIPAPAKWRYEELHAAYGEAEKKVNESLEVKFDLTVDEQHMCAMVDMLECMAHVADRILAGNHSYEAVNIYWNSRSSLYKRFNYLPLFAPVRRYMEELHDQVRRVYPVAGNTLD